MRKFLFLLFTTLAFASISDYNSQRLDVKDFTDFKKVSTKLAYNIAIKNEDMVKELKTKLYRLDKNRAENFFSNVDKVEKIFVKIFKTEKNLVPKIIKYIYFNPLSTNDENIIKDETQKILVSYYANTGAKIYINNENDKAERFINSLINAGAKKENLIIFKNLNSKQILEIINEDIKMKNPDVEEFGITEMRVLVIQGVTQTKEMLSLATVIFDKDIKGVEVEDFSFLDAHRKYLETTTDETRLNSFEQMINGMY